MTHERDHDSDVPNLPDRTLIAASQYLLKQATEPASIACLRQELSMVVSLLVPDFANEASIDWFLPIGLTQRHAMYASDELVFAADNEALRNVSDGSRIMKFPLTSAGKFVGSMLFTRLSTSRPFSNDERENSQQLTRLISRRIADTLAQDAKGDHEQRNVQPVSNIETSDAKLHRLCGVLSHELRNPLSVFRTAVDLMENDGESCSELQELLRLQTERMTHLVDDLLDMSRFTNGKTRLEKKPTPLSRIVNAACKSMESTLAAKQQELVTNLSSDASSTWIDGDRFRLTQVLINLLSNASKFSDSGDSIQLSVGADGDQVEIRVTDAGIGIGPDDLPTIFEFFSQSQSSDALDHSAGGLGIGLGLVKGLIEMHDGSVTAHSDGKNNGSTFVVRLPRCEPDVTSPEKPPSPHQSTCECVLIVDDRRGNAFILDALVKKIGVEESRCVGDGPSALETLRDFHPDLILLDLGLPGMPGLELARKIRELDHCRDTFIVALTGYDDQETRQAAELAGIDLYRLKPASIEMLQDVFRHASEKSQQKLNA